MQLETGGNDHKCEARLIAEARNLNSKGKFIIPIIDDAHLLPVEGLHKLRLLLEDFPKNHNLILLGQPSLNTTLQLHPNSDFKSRVTYLYFVISTSNYLIIKELELIQKSS